MIDLILIVFFGFSITVVFVLLMMELNLFPKLMPYDLSWPEREYAIDEEQIIRDPFSNLPEESDGAEKIEMISPLNDQALRDYPERLRSIFEDAYLPS